LHERGLTPFDFDAMLAAVTRYLCQGSPEFGKTYHLNNLQKTPPWSGVFWRDCWRWEIYRAGRSTPVFKSEKDYESMTEATREGRNGLARFLAEIAA